MNLLDHHFETPLENLICDEILLGWSNAGQLGPTLRFWEVRDHFVILGYGNSLRREVNHDACLQDRIPVFRRCSGGGAVLVGPGCLNYSLILPFAAQASFGTVTGANRTIMEQHRSAIERSTNRPIRTQGYTDLVWENLKFSGNAQRRKKTSLLFHGTFLLDFELPLMDRWLLFPSRQPDYRSGRSHSRFTVNLPLGRDRLRAALSQCWNAEPAVPDPALAATVGATAGARYDNPRWHCL